MTKDDIPSFNEDDLSLWKKVTESITKLTQRKHSSKSDKKIKTHTAKQESLNDPLATNTVKPNAQITSNEILNKIEPKQKRKLKKGHLQIDKVVDLHGYTIDQAHSVLIDTINKAYQTNKKHILVITGKGLRSVNQENTLKRNVPLWLNAPDIRPMISGVETANPNHGGEGALYVILKKHRN